MYSPIDKEKADMVQKILGKSDIYLQINKRKKQETRVAIGAPACRRTIERKGRGFNDGIKTKKKQNKTKVTPDKYVMASAK